MLEGFNPIIGNDPIALILGSMPSVTSLEKHEYYGFKHNRFWKIMHTYFQMPIDTYEQKKNIIKSHHLILWDVIKTCEREGSLDSSIHNVIVNPIDKLINMYPSIQYVICNGRKSYDLYKKHFSKLKINVIYLPSTSNANRTIKEEELLKQWKSTLKKIGENVMIKGVLFDFNGTMFFDGKKHQEAWNEFSIKYRNRPISDDEMKYMHGKNNNKIITELLGEMEEKDKTELSIQKEKLYRELCLNDKKCLHLVDGLEKLLNFLKENQVPMTICSASIKDNIDFYFSVFHLEKWFDKEKVVYDDGFHINKVSMFMDGAKNIGVDINECMIIEDSYSGIQYANECGAGSIIAITSSDKYDEFNNMPNVNKVILNFEDFDKFLINLYKK